MSDQTPGTTARRPALRLVCISDTHAFHEELAQLPAGDVLIHAGDFSQGSAASAQQFFAWFAAQPHRHKLVVPGNHDGVFETYPQEARTLVPEGVTLLIDEGCTIAGRHFWGSPWTPEYGAYYFMAHRGDQIARKWAAIPERTHILITHGPPAEILDWTPDNHQHVGCEALRWRVDQLPHLEAHIFGHIHVAYGRTMQHGRHFVNASLFIPDATPIVIDLPAVP
jgi:Icc-related predicted phosphoesterase